VFIACGSFTETPLFVIVSDQLT